VTRRVAQPFNSRATLFSNRALLCSVQLVARMLNADWSVLSMFVFWPSVNNSVVLLLIRVFTRFIHLTYFME